MCTDETTSASTPTLAQVLEAVEELWPQSLSEGWDATGLVVGRPETLVQRIHFAVDPVMEVVDEAVGAGAQLLITHHPLLLRGATTVAAGGHSGAAKGAVVHTLIEHGIGLVAAHTNADSAVGGVSDAIARRLGVHPSTVGRWFTAPPALTRPEEKETP